VKHRKSTPVLGKATAAEITLMPAKYANHKDIRGENQRKSVSRRKR
jgi:hypothetical protein